MTADLSCGRPVPARLLTSNQTFINETAWAKRTLFAVIPSLLVYLKMLLSVDDRQHAQTLNGQNAQHLQAQCHHITLYRMVWLNVP